MKTLNILDPILRIYFIFGPNIALHRAINNLIDNYEKIQNGRHAGRFSPFTLRMKTLNISEPIWQIYFIFVMNVALHRAITICIKSFEKIQNGHHAGTFTSSAPQMKTLNISDPIVQICFISGPNIALQTPINILSKNFQKIQNGHHEGTFTPSAP